MKKIRGYKRRLKQIESWRLENLYLDMNNLREQQRDYAKFRVYPWNPVAMSIRKYPRPKGAARRKILESLIDIYENWENQLKECGEPFYLKIWLFEPDIQESQVVCAIGDCLNFYDQTFNKSEIIEEFRPENYGVLAHRLNNYNWDSHIHEYALFECDYKEDRYKTKDEFISDKKWLEKELRKSHKVFENDKQSGKMYMIEIGKVWLGNRK